MSQSFEAFDRTQFYVDAEGRLVPVPGLVAHGSHDQKSHGNWSTGGGDDISDDDLSPYEIDQYINHTDHGRDASGNRIRPTREQAIAAIKESKRAFIRKMNNPKPEPGPKNPVLTPEQAAQLLPPPAGLRVIHKINTAIKKRNVRDTETEIARVSGELAKAGIHNRASLQEELAKLRNDLLYYKADLKKHQQS